MAMKFELTINNLETFIRMCHSTLFRAPYAGASSSQWLINYWTLIDKIDALIWHDTSEYKPSDTPKYEAAIIDRYIKEEFKVRFIMAEKQGFDVTYWKDSAAFADNFCSIWLDFIPGWKDENEDHRFRGRDLVYYRNHPRKLDMTFIVSMLDLIRRAILFQGAKTPNINTLSNQYGRILFRNHFAGDAYVEILSRFDDIDESFIDEYWGYEEEMLSVLHQTSGQEALDDKIYAIVSAISNMMITDSMISTASFKLGEYVTEKDESAGAEANKKRTTTVINPETAQMKEIDGELKTGNEDTRTITHHKIIQISDTELHELASEAIDEAADAFGGDMDSVTTDYDPEDDPFSMACYKYACKLFGDESGEMTETDIVARYIQRYFRTNHATEDGEFDDSYPDMMDMYQAVRDLIPSTMIMKITNDKIWEFDTTCIQYMANILDVLYRKLVNTCYATREMDNETIQENYTLDDVEEICGTILANMFKLAFGITDADILIDILIECWKIDPINANYGDITNIIMKYCLPVMSEVKDEVRDIQLVHPDVNFPDLINTHEAEAPAKTEESNVEESKSKELAPKQDDPEEQLKHDYPNYTFMYRIGDMENPLGRFVMCPTYIAMPLKGMLDGDKSMPCYYLPTAPDSSVLDNMIVRIIYPHVTEPTKTYIAKGLRNIYNVFYRNYFATEDILRSEGMMAAIQTMMPFSGYPLIFWKSAETKNGEPYAYLLSVATINKAVNAIMVDIFKKYGENSTANNPRPLNFIVDTIMSHVYPEANFKVVFEAKNSRKGHEMSVILKHIKEMIFYVLKSELYIANEANRRMFGNNYGISMDYVKKDNLYDDLRIFSLPDSDLARAIFFTIVHLCPYDDIMMRKDQDREDTQCEDEEDDDDGERIIPDESGSNGD